MKNVTLLCLIFVARNAFSVPPACKVGEPQEWCSEAMVAMKFRNAGQVSDIRLADGNDTYWQAKGWLGALVLRAVRTPSGQIQLTVSLPEAKSPLKIALLKKGEALTILSGRDVPKGYVGRGEASVAFISDE